jgi:hypothetical protein
MKNRDEQTQHWLVRLLSDLHLRVCMVFSLFAAALPAEGIPGFDLCWLHASTSAPCPGCGMTRCGSNLVRGNWRQAYRYHPLGVVIMPLIFGLGILALLPRRWRDAVRMRLAGRERHCRWAALILLASFVTFGIARWVLVYFEGWPFPIT